MSLPPKFRCADLFCSAGGASVGLHRAGFEVEGWDIANQKRYPFRFHLGDALEADLAGFDFVWASPPCQAFSVASQVHRNNGKSYPDLVEPTRQKLKSWGGLWIMENVPGSPLRCDVMLCGSMFGLNLVRHRIFETNLAHLILTRPCQHPELPVTVCGEGTPSWVRKRIKAAKHGTTSNFTAQEKRDALGIDWMSCKELSQAIPPAYSEFLGRQIIAQLTRLRTANHRPALPAAVPHDASSASSFAQRLWRTGSTAA